MKQEDLFNAITEVDRDLILDAGPRGKKKAPRWIWGAGIAAVLALTLAVSALMVPHKPEPEPQLLESEGISEKIPSETGRKPEPDARVYALGAPEYPAQAAFPENQLEAEAYMEAYEIWQKELEQRQDNPARTEDLESFLQKSLPVIMGKGEKENRIYSPVNLYLSLSVLAQCTEGQTQEEILQVLRADNPDVLVEESKKLWEANYSTDGLVTSLLGNSLWLDEDLPYEEDTVKALVRNSYASVFQGQMGSEAYNRQFHSWINAHTGNLLEDSVANLRLDEEARMSLVSTIYYQASWTDPFDKDKTEERLFYGAGEPVSVPFLQKKEEMEFARGQNFAGVKLPLSESGSMWLLLPREGMEPEALLMEEELAQFLTAPGEWKQTLFRPVHLEVPKFDISSDLSLKEELMGLGMEQVFSAAADFDPITPGDSTPLSQIRHAARVAIDEKGCTAAAYTAMLREALEEEPAGLLDFVLDRPFVFVISNWEDLPLFVGTVWDPVE